MTTNCTTCGAHPKFCKCLTLLAARPCYSGPCTECGAPSFMWWGAGIGCNHCVSEEPPADFFQRLGLSS